MSRNGYAGRILRLDLSSGKVSQTPTSDYSERFIGGHGLGVKIHWDEVEPGVSAFDPENRVTFAVGPMAGLPLVGGSRWEVCGKSPNTTPEQFSYCSLAGYWGAGLKFAGYDALVVHGKSDKPVYLYADNDVVEIRDASSLWGKTAIEARQMLEAELGNSIRVAACGQAGENLVPYAIVLGDHDASGTNGFGAVMGSKKLKAIAVRGKGKVMPANPEAFTKLAERVRELYQGAYETSARGTLPYAQAVSSYSSKTTKDYCYGCIGCNRISYRAADGTRGKFGCMPAAFLYHSLAHKFYGKLTDVPFFAAKLCDAYGLDAGVVRNIITWLSECQKAGILDDENTGIPLSKMGSLEFIETLVKQISLRQAFGEVLAQGLDKAAEHVGKGSKDLIGDYVSRDGKNSAYCPRLFPAHSILYAMEPRPPIHELHEIGSPLFQWVEWSRKTPGSYMSSDTFRQIAKRFWGSELAVDFSTHEGKALAAAKIEDRQCAKSSLILCDRLYRSFVMKGDSHIGEPELLSGLYSAVTGRETSEEEFYKIGERIFNLQRAVLVRERGGGRECDTLPEVFHTVPLQSAANNPDCMAPGKNGEVTSRKGTVVDRREFSNLLSEFYQIRGWDTATGLQTKAKLRELGLADVIDNLDRRGFVKYGESSGGPESRRS